MDKKLKTLLTVFIIIFSIHSCKQDEMDMDLLSDQVELDYTMAGPLIHGDFFLRTFVEEGDTVLIVEMDKTITDTFEFDIGSETNGFELEFFNLYFSNKNYIPVTLNLQLVSYDSITNTNLDTIRFSENGLFLDAAPIDKNGNAIEELVDSVSGVVNLSKVKGENILNVATHIILEARFISDTTMIIPVNDSKKIWFKYGFEAKGSYLTSI